jgi:hypothetical protein
MVCFTGAEPVVFAIATTGCVPSRALAHLALCACAILRREAADIIRVGWFAFPSVPEPFNDSITEIANPITGNEFTQDCLEVELASTTQSQPSIDYIKSNIYIDEIEVFDRW